MNKQASQTACNSLIKPPIKIQTKKSDKLTYMRKEDILKKCSFSSKKVDQSVVFPGSSFGKDNRSKSKSSKLTYNQSQSKVDSRLENSKLTEKSKSIKQVVNPIRNSKGICKLTSIRARDPIEKSTSVINNKVSELVKKKSIKFSSNTRNTNLAEHDQNISKSELNIADGSSNETIKRSKKSSPSLHVAFELKPCEDQLIDKPFKSEKEVDAGRKFSILDIEGTNNSQNFTKLNKVVKQPSKQSILRNLKNPRLKCLFLLSINK